MSERAKAMPIQHVKPLKLISLAVLNYSAPAAMQFSFLFTVLNFPDLDIVCGLEPPDRLPATLNKSHLFSFLHHPLLLYTCKNIYIRRSITTVLLANIQRPGNINTKDVWVVCLVEGASLPLHILCD